MLSRPSEWLKGRLVVEMGGRLSVGVCGTLLSQAGATVVFVEPRATGERAGKFANRELFSAGKRSLAVDPDSATDAALVADLIAKADIVLTSSDLDFFASALLTEVSPGVTVCNFSAIGRDSGEHGLTEPEVQALAGVAHTSGFPDGAPTVLRIPVLEYSAAVFGSAACAAALSVMRAGGSPQRIDVSLFECAIHLLASFLPSVFQGESPGRLGNGHPLAAPWNAYPTTDGWLLFCTASDVQWQKFCETSGRAELAADEKFKQIADRARHRAEVDAIVSAWTRQYDTETCLDRLARAGLAGGEIVPLGMLPGEANVVHRRSIVTAGIPGSHETILVPQGILATGTPDKTWQPTIPVLDAGRNWLATTRFEPLGNKTKERRSGLPLEGVRVIEIGQFTTAPLSARHLAMYGAEIIKIEPPMGDAARAWAPLVDGISMFFSISNSGKTCYKVDLRSPDGLKKLEDLVRCSDVLVENLKSGSLAALGLSAERMLELNPRLIYCPITGFGNHSAYPGRPAFDTVVQAMSGIMDANAVNGMPLKAGVSVCDVMGGEVALFAIMAALYDRQTSGRGTVLDLSMQDIAIWVTARLWNNGVPEAQFGRMFKCSDGYVLISSGDLPRDAAIADKSRDEVVSLLRRAAVRCVPVQTIPEALNSAVGMQLQPVTRYRTPTGRIIPLLASPVAMWPAELKCGTPPREAICLENVADVL